MFTKMDITFKLSLTYVESKTNGSLQAESQTHKQSIFSFKKLYNNQIIIDLNYAFKHYRKKDFLNFYL